LFKGELVPDKISFSFSKIIIKKLPHLDNNDLVDQKVPEPEQKLKNKAH